VTSSKRPLLHHGAAFLLVIMEGVKGQLPSRSLQALKIKDIVFFSGVSGWSWYGMNGDVLGF
jgi:hypothetical protein